MIGIFGGTFDPPHWGHVKLAKNFIEAFQLDELIWLPAGEPWQKSSKITPAETRYQMTLAAMQDLSDVIPSTLRTKVSVSRLELDRQGPSYTIDTAKKLRSLHGGETPLIWLMGADSYQNLPSWNDWELLPEYLHLAVASRKVSPKVDMSNLNFNEKQSATEMVALFDKRITQDPADLAHLAKGKVFFDENFHVDLSSTELREQLTQGIANAQLKQSLSPRVLEIINRLQIYYPH
ncbi:MAG: nicotinate (nicotinamide) nucleotide adenylyltransferase [Betaproteobacteria bacterium]|jgi:nicotinate-nucleotide adenylyltransferase